MGLFPEWAAIVIAGLAAVLIVVLVLADRRAARHKRDEDRAGESAHTDRDGR